MRRIAPWPPTSKAIPFKAAPNRYDAGMTRPPRNAILLIDVEPDERIMGDCNTWSGTHSAMALLDGVRAELETRTRQPVAFNWIIRMDPQVEKIWGRADWTTHSLPGLLEAISHHGDHPGIHVHLWKWHEKRQQWYSEFNDVAWLELCLRLSVETFAKVFGHPPSMCRFGDRWLSDDVLRLEAALGIQYDLTLEPGLCDMPLFDDPLATAWLPDFRRAPRHPYRPQTGNFLEPGGGAARPWMIPLSSTKPAFRPVRRPPYLLKASYPANLALSPRVIGPLLDHELDRATHDPLVVVLRSGDVGQPEFRANIERNFARLLAHPGLAHCRFTGPQEAIAAWVAAQG